jgi:cell division protein FtsB
MSKLNWLRAGCDPDPRAPHGYDNNASISTGDYVCLCRGWIAPEKDAATIQMRNDVLQEQIKTIQEELDATNEIVDEVYNALGVSQCSSRPIAAYIDDNKQTIAKQKREIEALEDKQVELYEWIAELIDALGLMKMFCKTIIHSEGKWWMKLFPRSSYVRNAKDFLKRINDLRIGKK